MRISGNLGLQIARKQVDSFASYKNFRDMTSTFWMAVVASFAGATGFALNLIVIMTRFLKPKSLTAFQLVVALMSVNDTILSILFSFVAAVMYSEFRWIYPHYACKLLFPAITTIMSVNVGCIFLISYERYRAVVHPFKRRLTVKQIWMATFLTWILCVLSSIPNILALKMQPYGECRESWNNTLAPKIYSVCLLLFVYLIPLTAIIIMHIRIGLRLRKSTKDIDKLTQGSFLCIHRKLKRNVKVVRLLVSIVLAFTALVLPTKIYYLIWDLLPHLVTESVSLVLDAYKSFFYIHVIVNPLLYSVTDAEFRRDVMDLFCCKLWKRNDQSSGILN